LERLDELVILVCRAGRSADGRVPHGVALPADPLAMALLIPGTQQSPVLPGATIQ
jgi:hypothetical protein